MKQTSFDLINKKVRLSDLASALNVTSSAIRQHLTNNKSGLGEGAEKFGHRLTGDYLLAVPSVLNFLEWLRAKSRKVRQEDIENVEQMLK